MEKHSKTDTSKEVSKHAEKGFFLTVDCCICAGDEVTFAGRTKKELAENFMNAGWRHLDSDKYGVISWWCGCDYKSTF